MQGSVFKGSLLIAGTAIGGGVLALPVLTSIGGFLPSMVIYFLCWAFMATTGLLFLELCFWMEPGSNIITMARRTLGTKGEIAAWVLYFFLFYSLLVAYIDGCGDLLTQALQEKYPDWFGQVLFLLIVIPFVFIGPRIVGQFTLFLMLGLGLSFLLFVLFGMPHVKTEFLLRSQWSYSWIALPVAFVTFAYQGVIPTLAAYMDYDVKRIRLSILIGSFLPLIVYIIWAWLILGIVPPDGPGGLLDALNKGHNAIYPLKFHTDIPYIYIFGQFLAFFALITSFFGVSLGLMDFLADGLKIKKNRTGKTFLCLLVFIPPTIVALTYPHLFLKALEFAGGFGVALLLGLLPILMVWQGRYHKGFVATYQVKGGKFLLSLLMLFVIIELCCELFEILYY